jgi:sporulation protein YlmC with PRC-barrel domain
MLDTYSTEQLRGLVGHEVIDADGDFVGYVDVVFVDDASGRPEWLGVWGGLPGEHRVLVPLRGIGHMDDEIRVPWQKAMLENGPRYDDEDHTGTFLRGGQIYISPERERAACAYYGRHAPAAAGSSPRLRTWDVEERAHTVRS